MRPNQKYRKPFPKKQPLTFSIMLAFAAGELYVPSVSAELALEEIVVTARKRQESIQDVPVAVTALTPADFERSAISNFEEATALTPGFTTSPSTVSPFAPSLSMRGSVQTDGVITLDQSVGVYLDGVYIARTFGIGVDLMDLESVQVLKGPQGTLFGRNTTAGAMLLQTKNPELEDLSVSLAVTAGQDVSRAEVIGNIPIGDKFALRFAAQDNQRDDYIRNIANESKSYDSEIGGRETRSHRIKALFAPMDSLEMVLSYEKFDAESSPARDQTWLGGFGPVDARGDDDIVSLSFDPKMAADTETTIFNLTYDTEIGELKFIYSTREYRSLSENDYDGADWAVDPSRNPNRRHGAWGRTQGDQDSYELQFNTNLFDDNVELVTGMTYFKEFAQLYDYSFGLNPFEQLAAGNPVIAGGNYVEQDVDSLGMYAQATWHITDVSNLTVGLRYTNDEKEGDVIGSGVTSLVINTLPSWDFRGHAEQIFSLADIGAVFGGADPTTLEVPTWNPEEEWNSTDWMITYDHQISQDVMAYVKASTGFRAGGFNGRGTAVPGVSIIYDPEELLEFELGMKGDFLDGRLRWNTALFKNTTEDKQLTSLIAVDGVATSIIRNVGEQEAQGLETEFTILLSEEWSLSGSYAYIDTEVTEVKDQSGNNLPNELLPVVSYVPENEFTLSLNFDKEFNDLRLYSTATYYWIDEKLGNDSSVGTIAAGSLTLEEAKEWQKGHTTDAFGTLNLSVTLATLDDRYSATFWGKNVLDERKKQNSIGFIADGFYEYANITWSEPMTWGVTVRANF